MDLFNKIRIFEPMKSHIYESLISLISLVSPMFNYVKLRIIDDIDTKNGRYAISASKQDENDSNLEISIYLLGVVSLKFAV